MVNRPYMGLTEKWIRLGELLVSRHAFHTKDWRRAVSSGGIGSTLSPGSFLDHNLKNILMLIYLVKFIN